MLDRGRGHWILALARVGRCDRASGRAPGDGRSARHPLADGTHHRRLSALPDGCPPREAVITAIGIRDTYRLARSCGVRAVRRVQLARQSPAPNAATTVRASDGPVRRCATTKAMIFSCQEARSAQRHGTRRMRSAVADGIERRTDRPSIRESSGGRKNAGTGSGQDGFRMGTIAGTHLALTSSRPGHTRVSSHSPERKRRNDRRRTADRTPLVGASALHGVSGTSSRSHLGSTLGSGKSCPDPGRLSTFGVSGLYPCRRLTYRGACRSMLARDPRLVKLGPQPLRNPDATSSAVRGNIHDCRLAVEAYPREHGQYFAGPQSRDGARPDVRRIEEPDVDVA